MAPVTDIETAWAAGLFEGEGCIGTRSGARAQVRLIIAMTDGDVVEKFHQIVGIGTLRGPIEKGGVRKPVWIWQVHGRKMIPLLEAFLPHFGHRRKAKALEALEEARRLRKHTGACWKGCPCEDTTWFCS